MTRFEKPLDLKILALCDTWRQYAKQVGGSSTEAPFYTKGELEERKHD